MMPSRFSRIHVRPTHRICAVFAQVASCPGRIVKRWCPTKIVKLTRSKIRRLISQEEVDKALA